jgi:hypothetical protein
MFKKIHIFILLLVVSVWTGLIYGDIEARSQQEIPKPEHMDKLILPDLTVEKIEVQTEPAESGKIKLTLRYTIFNDSSVHTKDYPTEEGKKAWAKNPPKNLLFECTVEAKVFPIGNYRKVGGGMADWCGPHEKKTFHETRIISPGSILQFRVKVDPGDWIREMNEKNNEKTYTWKSVAIKRN